MSNFIAISLAVFEISGGRRKEPPLMVTYTLYKNKVTLHRVHLATVWRHRRRSGDIRRQCGFTLFTLFRLEKNEPFILVQAKARTREFRVRKKKRSAVYCHTKKTECQIRQTFALKSFARLSPDYRAPGVTQP